MWWQLGYNEKDIFPRYTLAFAIPIAWIFFPLLDALPFVGNAKRILRKDLSVNAYRLEAWFVVDSTAHLIPMLVQSFLYLIVFFALSGVSNDPLVFFGLFGVLVGSFLTFQSIGLAFSAGISEKNVNTVAMIFVTFVFLFTGLFVPASDTAIPWAISVNPLNFILKLAVDCVFMIDKKKFRCGSDSGRDDGTIYPDSCDPGGDGRISVNEIYREYDLDRVTSGMAALALFIMFIGARLIAYYLLKRRMKKQFREIRKFEGDAPEALDASSVVVAEEAKPAVVEEEAPDPESARPMTSVPLGRRVGRRPHRGHTGFARARECAGGPRRTVQGQPRRGAGS